MTRPLVTSYEAPPEQSRVLLRPDHTPARTGPTFQQLVSPEDAREVCRMAWASEYLALDFETEGGDISDPHLRIVGLGLAWDTGSVYFDWKEVQNSRFDDVNNLLLDLLLGHPGLLAHNVAFDGGVLFSQFGKHGRWAACTFASYMLCSNEGFPGQKWGLKQAQKDILLWEETNDRDLSRWLCLEGFYTGTPLGDDSPENRALAFSEGRLSPDKGEMYRAPKEILGKYCILDAESCYLLWTRHLLPVVRQFPGLQEFLPQFTGHILLHVEQKMRGLVLDRTATEQLAGQLSAEITARTQSLRAHPVLQPHLARLEQSLLLDLAEKEPDQFLKQKVRPPEPPRFNKDGKQSKVWENWTQSADKYLEHTLSKNWKKWQERWKLALSGQDPKYQFNWQSDKQLRTLLYDCLGNPVRMTTDSGEPATGIKALKHMGEVGASLIERAYVEKELSYLLDYLDRTWVRDTIHPSFRLPGTKTGRLSSSKPNLQQVPKSKRVMSLFGCRPGYVLVDLDFSALEPVVATEFSQDPNMMEIYGDGRPPNDIYLYVGAHIPGDMGRKIRSVGGYDPRKPNADALAATKKLAKKERGICKTVVLACQYGAGVDKVMATLEQDDVFLPREEVEKIHSGYWDLFRGVKDFGYQLQRQWKQNGGYILNGLGRPMCIPEDYKHDALNRFIQSTGHDILVRYVQILKGFFDETLTEWYPYVIDWHDSAAIEVPEGQLEVAVGCYTEALSELNRQLQGTITLKGTPSWGRTMADIKEPES